MDAVKILIILAKTREELEKEADLLGSGIAKNIKLAESLGIMRAEREISNALSKEIAENVAFAIVDFTELAQQLYTADNHTGNLYRQSPDFIRIYEAKAEEKLSQN